MIGLDHKIFGSGYGLKSPYWDDTFYWLNHEDWNYNRCSGQLYKFSGGLGAQLTSFQWTHPRAGEMRRILGFEFQPFRSSRRHYWIGRDGPLPIPTPIARVEVSWALIGVSGRNLNDAHARIRSFKEELDKL